MVELTHPEPGDGRRSQDAALLIVVVELAERGHRCSRNHVCLHPPPGADHVEDAADGAIGPRLGAVARRTVGPRRAGG